MSDFLFLSGFAARDAKLHNLQNLYQTILMQKKQKQTKNKGQNVHIILSV